MKLLKIIEILKDVNNWHKDSWNGITHKPTGIRCYSGYNFWKDHELIYEPNVWAGLLTTFYVNVVRIHIKNRNKENNLDEIYNKWQTEYKNQSY